MPLNVDISSYISIWVNMEQEQGNTKKLIDELVEGLEPVKCMDHPYKAVVMWLLFAGFYVGAVLYYMGMRSDLVIKINDPTYLFEFLLITLTSLGGVICSSWMCIPDMRCQNWLISSTLTLFSVLCGWLVLHMVFEQEYMEHMHYSRCMIDSLIFGIVPAIAIVLFSMRGNTTHPKLMVLMNTIGVAGIGYLALRLTCGCDNIWHILLHHSLPFVLLGGGIALVGRKYYRW